MFLFDLWSVFVVLCFVFHPIPFRLVIAVQRRLGELHDIIGCDMYHHIQPVLGPVAPFMWCVAIDRRGQIWDLSLGMQSECG